MAVHIYPCEDFVALQKHIEPWLDAHPALFSLPIGILTNPRLTCWCSVLYKDQKPVVFLVQSIGMPVLIASPYEPDADIVEAILDETRQAGRICPGINGPIPWVDAVHARCARSEEKHISIALHGLEGKPQRPNPCPGSARVATSDDCQQLAAFMFGFERDIQDVGERKKPVASDFESCYGDFLFWEHHGVAVSVARRARPVLDGWSISAVYTPPEQRGRGYAGAVVQSISQQLLDEGARYVVLYTDLSNPTSNKLYYRIGYRKIVEQKCLMWQA